MDAMAAIGSAWGRMDAERAPFGFIHVVLSFRRIDATKLIPIALFPSFGIVSA
jgi:hypothetical protein